MRRSAAVIAVTALLVTIGGCGASERSSASGDVAKTRLTITLVSDEGVDPKVTTLTCDPAGGDNPQPAQACGALKKAGAKVFKPVPKSQVCSMLYGGPQTATVKGTYDGTKVDAIFKRTNGCETARWDKLGTTFFNVPMQ